MTFRSTIRAIAVLATLCAAACVTTAVTRVGEQMSRPLVPMDQVVIYRTAAQVPGKYVEVALLNSSGAAGWTDEEKMFKNMRYEAGRVGAKAIILDAISEPSAGAKVAAAVLGVGAEPEGKSSGDLHGASREEVDRFKAAGRADGANLLLALDLLVRVTDAAV